MYDELVKRLRDAATMSEALAVLLPHSEGNATAKLYNEAADAIESTNKAYQMMAEAYESEVTKHCWIPVTERLPESPFGCLLVVWDSTYSGHDFLNVLPYFAGWDGEQWNDDNGEQMPFEVEYWMPIPELPKEVEHD